VASFDFDLEEVVTYGGREVPLRQALDESQQCGDGSDHRVGPGGRPRPRRQIVNLGGDPLR
jgi:hypothetical protein